MRFVWGGSEEAAAGLVKKSSRAGMSEEVGVRIVRRGVGRVWGPRGNEAVVEEEEEEEAVECDMLQVELLLVCVSSTSRGNGFTMRI